MKRYTTQEGFDSPIVDSSKHDATNVTLTLVVNQYHKHPQTTQSTLGELKEFIINEGTDVVAQKERICGLMPASYPADVQSKAEVNAIARHLLILDFDIAPDLTYITSQLSPFVFYGWTTHSHNTVGKGNRYRFVIPFVEAPTVAEWKQLFVPRIKAWFSDSKFVDDNKVDQSCLTFSQIGFLPAINPLIGLVEYFFNDADETRIFSLDCDLPQLTEQEIAHETATISLADWQPSSEQMQVLISTLMNKPRLSRIDANPTPENKGVNRKTIAVALQSLNADFADYATLDQVMRKGDSRTTTTNAWEDAKAIRNKHAGILFKLLSPSERRLVGLTVTEEVAASVRRTWSAVKEVTYLTRKDYGDAKTVLVNADMGTGKNYLWTQHTNIADDRVIVLSPLKTIVQQQGSTNKANVESNITFTYDQAKNIIPLIEQNEIDPLYTTLVIDECHNLLLAEYRMEALSNVERLLAYPFKQIIFQSATIEPDSFDDFFTFEEHLRYAKVDGPSLNYTMVNVGTSSIETAILNVINAKLGMNHKMLCLWNNKDELTALKMILQKAGITAEVISADKVRDTNTEAFQLANDVDYKMEGLQVLFGTTSLVEGVSIKDEIELGTVIIVGKEPPQYIKQMCGRFRCAKRVECWHFTLTDEEVETDVEQWLTEKRMDIILKSEMAAAINKTLSKFNYSDHIAFVRSQSCAKSAHLWAAKNGLVFDTVTNQYLESKYGQLFLNSELEKVEFYSSRDCATAVMSRLGFNILPIQKGMVFKATAADKKAIGEIKKKTKTKLINARRMIAEPVIDAIYSIVEHYGEDFLSGDAVKLFVSLEEQRDYSNSFQNDLLEAVEAITVRHKNAELVVEQIEKLITKKQTVAGIETRSVSERAESGIYKELMKDYPVGSVLTVQEQRDLIARVVTTEMQRVSSVRAAYTLQEQFNEVAKMKALKAAVKKNKIRFENGSVIVDIKSPILLINQHWLSMASETRWIDDKSIKIGVVQ